MDVAAKSSAAQGEASQRLDQPEHGDERQPSSDPVRVTVSDLRPVSRVNDVATLGLQALCGRVHEGKRSGLT